MVEGWSMWLWVLVGGAAWVYEMWRELSEMVHTTGLEMDGWGSSNLWRMDRPVGGWRAPGWEFWGEQG